MDQYQVYYFSDDLPNPICHVCKDDKEYISFITELAKKKITFSAQVTGHDTDIAFIGIRKSEIDYIEYHRKDKNNTNNPTQQ